MTSIQNIPIQLNSKQRMEGIKIYFIGIGGIGMSALAKYFFFKGAFVKGFDRTKTTITTELVQMGIDIHYEENLNEVLTDATMVIYTPAIPESNIELQYFRSNKNVVLKRSDVLEWITNQSMNICVSGTHGKTTTSTMIAHILRHSGYGCTAFLGGISSNYQTNFWSNDNNVVVVEADEYDRSFLKLTPDIAIITAMDADHLDIYKTEDAFEEAFIRFSEKIKTGGLLISKYGLKRTNDLRTQNHLTYSFNNTESNVYASNVEVIDGGYHFTANGVDWKINHLHLNMGGLHNIENAVAAITVAHYLGIEDASIIDAIATFKGVKRRFEFRIKTNKNILIDDYAHHPAELSALLSGIRSLYPTSKVTLIFQPHLYSRTNDLADDFALSLDKADEVILLPIYPARELPMEGVSSQLLLDKMKLSNKHLLEKDDMLDWVTVNKPSLVVMAGAGDIDVLVPLIEDILKKDN